MKWPMNRQATFRVTLILTALTALAAMTGPVRASEPVAASDEAPASPALVREIQFMLLTLGLDPGPIDGNPRQLTNRAVHTFQARAGLPVADIALNAPVPPAFLERLRREAAQVMFKSGNPPTPPPAASEPATAAVVAPPPAQPPPPPQAPDPFAACPSNANDFRIGGKQYTTQSFLNEGFDGSSARAVTELRKRLDEARVLAERIGGAALMEVQRQARVLAYFECRLKIEQASGKS